MICWIESVDSVTDLCLTNQVYSVLLNAFEFKEIPEVQNAQCFSKMVKRALEDARPSNAQKCCQRMAKKRNLVVASTRHHFARLLKYYPRPPCAPSFVKSRMLGPMKTYFLVFQQSFFILVCIHAGNPKAPPRVLA